MAETIHPEQLLDSAQPSTVDMPEAGQANTRNPLGEMVGLLVNRHCVTGDIVHMSEHFDHAEKRNDPRPTFNGRVV